MLTAKYVRINVKNVLNQELNQKPFGLKCHHFPKLQRT